MGSNGWTDEQVEKGAIALLAVDRGRVGYTMIDLTRADQDRYRRRARAVLESVDLVPREEANAALTGIAAERDEWKRLCARNRRLYAEAEAALSEAREALGQAVEWWDAGDGDTPEDEAQPWFPIDACRAALSPGGGEE